MSSLLSVLRTPWSCVFGKQAWLGWNVTVFPKPGPPGWVDCGPGGGPRSCLTMLSTAQGLVDWVGDPFWGLILAYWPGDCKSCPGSRRVRGLCGERSQNPGKPWSAVGQNLMPVSRLCATALESHCAPHETRGGHLHVLWPAQCHS